MDHDNLPQGSIGETAEARAQSMADAGRSITGDLNNAKESVAGAAKTASQDANSDIGKLQADVAALTDTMTKFMAEVSGQTSRTLKSVGETVSHQVQATASDIASASANAANAATEQAKTFASEMENMGRKNPLGAMAGALMVGVVIGLLGRRG